MNDITMVNTIIVSTVQTISLLRSTQMVQSHRYSHRHFTSCGSTRKSNKTWSTRSRKEVNHQVKRTPPLPPKKRWHKMETENLETQYWIIRTTVATQFGLPISGKRSSFETLTLSQSSSITGYIDNITADD